MAIAPVVADYLAAQHISFTTCPHRPAFTAQEKAAAAHVKGHEWGKVVVCFADGEPVLAVVPAPCTVDPQRLGRLVGARHVRLAREEEFAALYPGCERGAIPPLGPLFHQRVILDDRLTREPVLVFDGGTHDAAIRMSYADFAALAHPVVGAFAEGPRH